ncbi:1-deoxy-D-xylulose-5-phosphate synthase [uncultured Roseburia sp.]|uniref:Transketolase family protein n=1 Tax=Brotonthovivens ammoniilytica TaxID=2981725 RepID=A0ABT2TFX4_9FIRM|nr:transketolase C-terminal domain-containing protein [Brotonthovivens ammoniilytica]MCU6761090.1 transketolase family protein [Brotonthovivens ammoniilytica]SCI18532.1 1-deoxy-D-xylulose-5-phosphate synthase [uncultured Roseburia sp.]
MIELAYNGKQDEITIKDSFGAVLEALFEEDPDVIYLDADLMNSMGTYKLAKRYPDRCIDCGIQEANMIGVAAGASAVGKKPYVHTFGPFAGRRCYDQVFISVGYAKNNVRIIGSDAGVTAAYNGGTHMPFEDIALYRAIPRAMIIDAADQVQFEAAVRQTKDREGVTYIRCPRKGCTKVYGSKTEFIFGKANVLKEGTDCAVIASGIMTAEALNAAEHLEKEGIKIAVIDPVTIKPLDEETVLSYAEKCGAVVTAENATVVGGLGSAVCELLGEKCPVPIKRIGVQDLYGEVGDVNYLKERFGLTAKDLMNAVKEIIARK